MAYPRCPFMLVIATPSTGVWRFWGRYPTQALARAARATAPEYVDYQIYRGRKIVATQEAPCTAR